MDDRCSNIIDRLKVDLQSVSETVLHRDKTIAEMQSRIDKLLNELHHWQRQAIDRGGSLVQIMLAVRKICPECFSHDFITGECIACGHELARKGKSDES